MYRLQYIDKLAMRTGFPASGDSPSCEWFLTEADAMEVVNRLGVEKYSIRFVEFPFTLTRHSVGPMSSASEDAHKLQWLNKWADTFAGF